MICPISDEYILTTSAVRQDDGGQPEEFFVTLTQYNGGLVLDPEPYDTRVDTSFTFKPATDGVYFFNVIGGVSGLVDEQAIVVNHNSLQLIKTEILEIMDSIMCGCCGDYNLYIKAVALLPSTTSLTACRDYANTEKRFRKIREAFECRSKCSGGSTC